MTTVRRHNFANDALPTNIGASIGRLREQRGWSKAELAIRSGVPRETVSRVEAGKRLPLADTVLRLLVILLADQDEFELGDIVPDWPEADGRQVIGHGPRSRVRRRQLGLTASEVAAAVGVSEATLSRFERDASATPTLLATDFTAHGDEMRRLRSEKLASVLRFAGLADHEAFSDADDWLEWPTQSDPVAQGR
jgi:transcriptional regulator with XRE-family HTH domain